MIVKIPDNILIQYKLPGVYAGTDDNMRIKEWTGDKLKICLIYPDLYEVGSSNNAIRILYHILNEKENIIAERAFLPYPDMLDYMQHTKTPVFSIETHHELADFDIVAFTLPYELCYTNILKILDLSAIPLHRSERTNSTPLIMAGGIGAINPTVLEQFIDIFFIGEAEVTLPEVLNTIAAIKKDNRESVLQTLTNKFDFLYIPGHSITAKISKVPPSFSLDTKYYEEYLTPLTKSVHNRGVLEIMRGCPNNCRFCLAGYFYRPTREEKLETLIKNATALAYSNGFEEISLTSLSTMDYHYINEAVRFLSDEFRDRNISLSISSLRIDRFSVDMANMVGSVRHTGLTFAPETGNERLRKKLNKNISDSDIFDSIEYAMQGGYNKIKLYFMIGLPEETLDDVKDIASLSIRIFNIMRRLSRRAELSITVSNFVPKPHTPFQNVSQDSIELLREKQQLLLSIIRKYKHIRMKFHLPEMSFIEGLISRGDERIGALIYEAYKNGALMDQWHEHFNYSIWNTAIDKLRINTELYLNAAFAGKPNPWAIIDIGVPETFYKKEMTGFEKNVLTPGCFEGCKLCEGCNSLSKISFNKEQTVKIKHTPLKRNAEQPHTFRIKIDKRGMLKFISHNDFFTYFKRQLRKNDIAFDFTQGFRPHEKIAAGYPGFLGIESQCEYFDITCYETKISILDKLQNISGVSVLGIAELSGKINSLYAALQYEAYLSNKKLDNAEKFLHSETDGTQFLYIVPQPELKEFRTVLKEHLPLDTELHIVRFEQYLAKQGDEYIPILAGRTGLLL